MLLPGKIIVNRTRSALSSAAHRISCQIGAPVYVQGLTGDKPCILGCQKHRRSGDPSGCAIRPSGTERPIS